MRAFRESMFGSGIGSALWDNLVLDVRYGLRTLLKAPGFTLAVVATLALGIGANTAIFTVINSLLLRALPYPDSERIVKIGRRTTSVSEPMFAFWEQHNPGFEDLSAFLPATSINLIGGDRPELATAIKASKNYFHLFGAAPILGRTFTADDDHPVSPPVLLMSYGLWRDRFAGDQSIVGRTVNLGGSSCTVVGVLSPTFKPEPPADIWVPLQADASSTNVASVLSVVARLPRGMSIEQANSMIRVLSKRYAQADPKHFDREHQYQVSYLRREMTGNVRPALLILFGAVALVLLIACANVANLLLARAVGRQREIAIRSAIGASGSRIARQLLTESLLLAFAGGLLGLAVGSWGVHGLLALAPGDLPRIQELTASPALDPSVATFALALAILTGIFFGLFPALQLSRPDLVSALKETGSQVSVGLKHSRMRSLLVAGEATLAVVLLCAAVLLIRSFVAMHSVDPGFDPHNLLTMEISLDASLNSADAAALGHKLTDAIERIPGVESAALASALPLWGRMDMVFNIPGRVPAEKYRFTGDVQWRFVTPKYFDVLKIPLLAGRLPHEKEPTRIVLVSQALARKYWPNENPVGKTILIGPGLGPAFDQGPVQIIGVVGDMRERLDDDWLGTIMYQLPAQIPDRAMTLIQTLQPSAILVRTRSGFAAMSVSETVKQTMLKVGNVPATNVRTMEQVALDSTAQKNFNLALLGLFAALAVLLAGVGIYGVMSYSVEQRTHEIGIRAALGATPLDTLKLVLGQALRMSTIGVAAGIIAAFGLMRVIASQLFHVKPTDPLTFVLVPIILSAIALAGAFIPALRAIRTDPMIALRQE